MRRARNTLHNTRKRRNITNKVTLFAEGASVMSYLKMLRVLPSQVAHGIPTWSPRPGLFFASSWCFRYPC
jgi:hypothetical protein